MKGNISICRSLISVIILTFGQAILAQNITPIHEFRVGNNGLQFKVDQEQLSRAPAQVEVNGVLVFEDFCNVLYDDDDEETEWITLCTIPVIINEETPTAEAHTSSDYRVTVNSFLSGRYSMTCDFPETETQARNPQTGQAIVIYAAKVVQLNYGLLVRFECSPPLPDDYLYARDSDGHGSHTARTLRPKVTVELEIPAL